MNPADFTFETLKAQFSGDTSLCSSLAYWIGVLSDPTARFAREASFACDVMSYHYDAEEQAIDIDGLCSYPDIIPEVFHPIAPVTLAYRWSPFPAAFAALGQPTHVDRNEHANALAVFRPVELPTFQASTADELHFQFLLEHACERALRLNRWVLLAGSPGWSYELTDYVAGFPSLQEIMAAFGFVYFARKPRGA